MPIEITIHICDLGTTNIRTDGNEKLLVEFGNEILARVEAQIDTAEMKADRHDGDDK